MGKTFPSPVIARRALLLGGASFAAWAYLPKFAYGAEGRDPRLIVIILRGALDGLATAAPLGDPDYAGLHGPIALAPDGPHAAIYRAIGAKVRDQLQGVIAAA